MSKVLLLDGDSTQALPLSRSLKKKGYNVDIVEYTKWGYGSASRFVNNRFLFLEHEDVEKYHEFLLPILKKGNYDTVIPCDDYGAMLLSKYQDEYLKYTQYKMPSFNVFEKGYDKHKLMELCQQKGYPHPQTILMENGSLDNLDLSALPYPLLIKPNHTCGARGMTYVRNSEELEQKFPLIYKEYGDCHLQQFIPAGGHQVEVQLYVGDKGELVQASVIKKFRWYPENGGSSCCNVSTVNPKIVDICYNILRDLNWIGFADFDTIEDPRTGELLIMEINPRVPACVKSAFISGIDWADIIVNEYLNKPHRHYVAKEGLYLRHFGFECLWFMYSKSRFKTKPNWFNLFGKNIFYQDMSGWDDPMPFFVGSFGNFMKQLSPEFRKAKNGTR